jgi:hypothetical protein
MTLKVLGAASLSGGPRQSDESVVFGPGKPLALLALRAHQPHRLARRFADPVVDGTPDATT